MRIYKVSAEVIYNDLLKNQSLENEKFVSKQTEIEDSSVNNTLEMRNVSFSYKGSNITPIKKINLSINQGDVIAVTGKTGSGKNTLFLMLLGLLQPTSGNIFYNGENIFNHMRSWRRLVGYVSQKVYLLIAQ